ncbi:hypothetical protein DY000_02018552 [Brassica cretica]|uniref:RRM domain-containing protein n=1 Tax=Brassica cretica TaxID=69181 RepID=A0ABQ7CMT3_BRACR|nr:hypothetical protein DY000_02018552 [Brassica cretica]
MSIAEGKSSRIFSVLDYGAKGDGTNDDTKARLGCRRNGYSENVANSGRLRLTDILKWLVILKYNYLPIFSNSSLFCFFLPCTHLYASSQFSIILFYLAYGGKGDVQTLLPRYPLLFTFTGSRNVHVNSLRIWLVKTVKITEYRTNRLRSCRKEQQWFREPGGFGFVKYRYAEDAAKAMKLKKRHWPQKLKSVYFLFDSGTGLEVCQGHVLGPSVADLAIQVEREKRFSSFAMDVHLCAYFVLII